VKSWSRIAFSAVLVTLGARVAYLFIAYITGAGSVQRHHVESAATLFVVVAVALKYFNTQLPPGGDQEPGPADWPIDRASANAWVWASFCAAAIVLYWRALFVGFLSDDYGLVARAAAWDLSPVSAVLFRPLPLLLWAVLLQAGAGPVVLHFLNVVLHGTNACLSSVVAAEWACPERHRGAPRRWRFIAGLLVLTAPLAPEAVVWCSGVFDVLATTLVLSAVLVSFQYSRANPSRAIRAAFIAANLGAVLSKETAAVAPVLVLIVAWARNAVSAPLRRDLAIVIGVNAAFGLARFLASPEVIGPVTKYVLQRAFFSGFGSLAMPYHASVLQQSAWIAIASVLIVITLVTLFCVSAGPRRDLRIAIASVLWIVVSFAPVIPILVIPANLQASRYLYLAAIGWTMTIIVTACRVRADRARVVAGGFVVALLMLNTIALTAHLTPWIDAAHTRDAVERAARSNPRMQACGTLAVSGLPDSVDGAYVFRNSVSEAFERDLGLKVVTEGAGCAFEWNGREFTTR
jgi:hypothetical protein